MFVIVKYFCQSAFHAWILWPESFFLIKAHDLCYKVLQILTCIMSYMDIITSCTIVSLYGNWEKFHSELLVITDIFTVSVLSFPECRIIVFIHLAMCIQGYFTNWCIYIFNCWTLFHCMDVPIEHNLDWFQYLQIMNSLL